MPSTPIRRFLKIDSSETTNALQGEAIAKKGDHHHATRKSLTSKNDAFSAWQQSVAAAEWVLSDVEGRECVAGHVVERRYLCLRAIQDLHVQGSG